MSRRKKMDLCRNCYKEVSRTPNIYCSNKCQLEYQYRIWIDSWLAGKEKGMRGTEKHSPHITRYLMDLHEKKCEECGWGKVNIHTGRIPLQVHHIDGNYLNNSLSNLELLCPSCHSLTENYGGANKGNGRPGK